MFDTKMEIEQYIADCKQAIRLISHLMSQTNKPEGMIMLLHASSYLAFEIRSWAQADCFFSKKERKEQKPC